MQKKSLKCEQRTANSIYYSLKIFLKRYRLTYVPLHFINELRIIITQIIFSLFYTIILLPYFIIRNLLYDDIIFGQTCSRLVIHSNTSNYGNWGDGLSCSFVEYVTGKKVVVCNFLGSHHGASLIPIKRYSLIGSIISFYSLRNSIVYGTGIMTAEDAVWDKPQKIISVRGPLTRKALLRKGINCPEKYGDPALLLPLFYSPKSSKRSGITLIPNLLTIAYEGNSIPSIKQLTEKYHCEMLSMTDYDKWTDIIDRIASSSFIISESLHGLITAETYGIPSVWVELTDHKGYINNNDWCFKYLDFYESIGKYGMSSIKLYEGFNFDDILREKDKWQPGKINYAELLSLFPFEIKPEFLPRIKKFLPNN